jgi:hypothetical protein
MYEKPNLNRVGAVQEVVLGMLGLGGDFDATTIPDGQEFAFDGDIELE